MTALDSAQDYCQCLPTRGVCPAGRDAVDGPVSRGWVGWDPRRWCRCHSFRPHPAVVVLACVPAAAWGWWSAQHNLVMAVALGNLELSAWAVVVLGLVGWAVVVDIRIRRLPHLLILPAVACGAGAVAGAGVWVALVGAGVWAGVYLAVYVCGGMGGGDVTTAVALGMVLGGEILRRGGGVWVWPVGEVGVLGAVWWVLVVAQLSTVCLGLLGRRKVVAHGPHMYWPVIVVLCGD